MQLWHHVDSASGQLLVKLPQIIVTIILTQSLTENDKASGSNGKHDDDDVDDYDDDTSGADDELFMIMLLMMMSHRR